MNPYDVLGVPRSADLDEIRKAYRRLARQYHPDRNKDPAAESRFKEANAAHDILGDPEKRKLYDEFGEASARPGFDPQRARSFRGGGPAHSPFSAGFGGAEFDSMDDILGAMFGAGGRPRAVRGRDLQVHLRVPFMACVLGGSYELGVPRPTGGQDSLQVPVPPGARDGGKVRLKGHGAPPSGGGACGDLIVVLDVEPHPILRRDLDGADDLRMDVPITILEAIAGANISVPTPTGPVKLSVQPGVGSGRVLRLKGRGVQRRDAPGDLYIHLVPTAPEGQSPQLLEAAKVIDEAYTSDVRAHLAL